MDNHARKRIGVAAVLAATVMWAIQSTVVKLACASADVFQTVTIMAVVTSLTALLYTLITNKGSLKITRGQLPKVVYIALAGTVFADLFYFSALTMIPVVNAVLIAHLQPIFIVLAGFLFLKGDKLTRYDYSGILVLIIAGLLVSTRTVANLTMLKLGTFGDILVLLATFAWATAAIVARKYLGDMNTGVLTFYRFTIASVALGIILLFKSSIALANVYQIIAGIAVGIGYILYYEGLKRIKAAQASALELSTPFFASITGFVILGEAVTVMQMFGIAALFLGAYFLSKKEDALS